MGVMNRAIADALRSASVQSNMPNAVTAFKTSLHGAGFAVVVQKPPKKPMTKPKGEAP
jgi:hypothetical protein